MPDPHQKLMALRRRKQVAEMYLRGDRQSLIAERLEVSVKTVEKDLAFVRKEWLKTLARNYDERKADELARIDRLEKVAWDAYERSIHDGVTVTTRTEQVRQNIKVGKGERPRSKMVPLKEVTETTRRGQVGDPRFLEQVAWCIETRIKLLGLVKEGERQGNVLTINWGDMTVNAPTVIYREEARAVNDVNSADHTPDHRQLQSPEQAGQPNRRKLIEARIAAVKEESAREASDLTQLPAMKESLPADPKHGIMTGEDFTKLDPTLTDSPE